LAGEGEGRGEGREGTEINSNRLGRISLGQSLEDKQTQTQIYNTYVCYNRQYVDNIVKLLFFVICTIIKVR